MAETLLLGFALFLTATMAGGFVRIVRGPSLPDRMMAALLLGTTGVAILLLLAQALQAPALRDVALVFALLAAVTGITFVRRTVHAGPLEEGAEHDA